MINRVFKIRDEVEELKQFEIIIDKHISIFNLEYSTKADRGNLIDRKIMRRMDIDLRSSYNGSLNLQFWSTMFIYAFEWRSNKKMFLQVVKGIQSFQAFEYFNRTETVVRNLMDAVVKNNDRYIASKYRLK